MSDRLVGWIVTTQPITAFCWASSGFGWASTADSCRFHWFHTWILQDSWGMHQRAVPKRHVTRGDSMGPLLGVQVCVLIWVIWNNLLVITSIASIRWDMGPRSTTGTTTRAIIPGLVGTIWRCGKPQDATSHEPTLFFFLGGASSQTWVYPRDPKNKAQSGMVYYYHLVI